MRVNNKYSWEAPYYLKGVAISSVLINHYVNGYITGDHTGFSNGIIAIFFLLSGFGIFCSFEKRLNGKNFSFKKVARYYLEMV